MQTTMQLLDRGLEGRKLTELADEIGVHYTAIVNARKVGHLSALLAGQIALFLSENVERWMAIAAIESARKGKARTMLERHLRAAERVEF